MALLISRGQRERRGSAVTVSLFDTMMDLMGYPLTYAQHSGIDQEPLGMNSPAVAPYGSFDTADNQTVVLGTTNDREWQRLAREIIDRPDLADDPRYASNSDRCAHRDELNSAIKPGVRSTISRISKTADAAGIGNARYNLPSEVLAHPQLSDRDRWRTVETTAGPIQAILPPPIIENYEQPMGPVPGLGEHTDALLAELGLSDNDIGRLREQGAVA